MVMLINYYLVLEENPYHVFTMPIKTEGFEEESEDGLFILLKVTYTAKYPEELPLIELEECVNIDEYDLRSHLMEHLTEQVIFMGTPILFWNKAPPYLHENFHPNH